MTFDNLSLERLKELGRQLPKEIKKTPSLTSSTQAEKKNSKLHPVESENNPEQLFRELMKISPDGNVPPHLLDRLKEIEADLIKPSENNISESTNNSPKLSNNEIQDLYITFKQLLLED